MKIGTHSSAIVLRKWRVLSNYMGMACPVQSHCPINAQMGPVNNQSVSRIFL